MRAGPLVSVIIPAFNAERWIAGAIESALGQGIPNEVIVVDDGSTDATALTASRFGASVRVLSKKNGGVSSARNCGLQHANGDFVAFLDADDRWHSSKLRKQLECFEADPELGAVACDERHVDADGRVIVESFFRTRSFYSLLPSKAGRLRTPVSWLVREPFLPTSSVVVRRNIARAVGGFDEGLRLVEDRDYFLRLAFRAPVGVVNEVLVDYFVGNAQSLSKVKEEFWAQCILKVLLRHEREIQLSIVDEGLDPGEIVGNVFARLARSFWHGRDFANACLAYSHSSGLQFKDFLRYATSRALTAVRMHGSR